MTEYRKKPVVIEAEQYKEGMEDGFEERYIDPDDHNLTWGVPVTDHVGVVQVPYIATLEGKHLITKGDWIITGIKGERYPIKPDIFEETYELVE